MPYVLEHLKTEAFIGSKVELYCELRTNPELRMIPIERYNSITEQLSGLGYKFRIRYRGPHKPLRDTLKSDARAFTVYMY